MKAGSEASAAGIPSNGTAPDDVLAVAMRGNAAAIQALWQLHRRWVAAVVLAHKSPGDDLEDVLQEVAITLFTKINTLRDQANLRAWLRVVAVNAARAAARSGRTRPRLSLAGASSEQAAPSHDQAFEVGEHAQRVMRLAAQLPDAYREPLLLKAVHGMRSRHIAEIMGIPEATVDTRVSRARRMLRELVGEDEAQDVSRAGSVGSPDQQGSVAKEVLS